MPVPPDADSSRSGFTYLPDEAAPRQLVDAIRARRPGGRLLHLDRVLLHSPPLAEGWNALIGAIRGRLALPALLREQAILAIGALNGAAYEWAQHEPEYRRAGGTAAQVEALRDPRAALSAPCFDATERAALALTCEMTDRVEVAPETLRRLRELLPEAQVVELLGTVAAYNMVSRFVVATGLELE